MGQVGQVRAPPPHAPARHFRATNGMVHQMDQNITTFEEGLAGALEYERAPLFRTSVSYPLFAFQKLGATRAASRQVFPQSSCTSAGSFQPLFVRDRVALLGHVCEGRCAGERGQDKFLTLEALAVLFSLKFFFGHTPSTGRTQVQVAPTWTDNRADPR